MGTKRSRGGTAAKTIIGTTAAVVAAAVAGTIATDPGSRWYRRLRKPPWQPPRAAFPIAWTSLYASIAGAGSTVLILLRRRGLEPEAQGFRRALALNLVLNAAWSALFWRVRNLDLAAIEAGALAVSSADLARRARAAHPALAAAFVPYAAWSAFAAALSARIANDNRR